MGSFSFGFQPSTKQGAQLITYFHAVQMESKKLSLDLFCKQNTSEMFKSHRVTNFSSISYKEKCYLRTNHYDV